MEKIRKDKIKKDSESMMKLKTNQDFNSKQPDPKDPNEKNQNQNLDGHESRDTAVGQEGDTDKNLV
jgi:hypothetical protein